MKHILTVNSLSLLGKVAANNERFMRETAAKARNQRDWSMVNRADLQARKWAAIAATEGNRVSR